MLARRFSSRSKLAWPNRSYYSLTTPNSHKQEIETHLATKAELAEVKAEILKWMFIFWAGQIGALLAILKLVIVK